MMAEPLKKSYPNRILQKIFGKLKINVHPQVKVYDGFGNAHEGVLYGHTLKVSPIPRKSFRDIVVTNVLAVLRLFIVDPKVNAEVRMVFMGNEYLTRSENDGFFKFDWKSAEPVPAGEHPVVVEWLKNGKAISAERSTIRVPYLKQYIIISDIDDTFLVSHSSTILKRMYVLLTENAYSRQPFEDVVRHYQLLKTAGTDALNPNPFFFVSSSEWNLYDYIKNFMVKNGLPDCILLLNQIKTFSQLLKTGKNNHGSKFVRIVRIVDAYPQQRFILLGDDSQRDAFIYYAICKHYPERIRAVYLRKVHPKPRPDVVTELDGISSMGIAVNYFSHSREAIEHSQAEGIIQL